MQALKIYRETALPGTLEAYAIYLIAPAARPDYVEVYVSNSDGSAAKRIINQADITALIANEVAAANELIIVADIAERNALSPTTVKWVYVKDASADPEVDSGGATYVYDLANTSWIRTNSAESLTVSVAWSDVTGRPSSTVADIDASVAASHSHSNKSQLDKIDEDANGNMTYSGSLPATGWNSTGW